MYFLLSIGFILTGCTGEREYNFGYATTSQDDLKDVVVELFPKGNIPGKLSMDSNSGVWLSNETHWPVPEGVKVTFYDPSGNFHELQASFSLSKNFRGDILVVIHKENGTYLLKTFTGKLGKLKISQALRDLGST